MDDGLKLIEKRQVLPCLHSLVKSWSALYGYASAAGVRHGMTDGQQALELEDALHLVVTCSAIVSFLTALARRKGLKLG